MLYYFKAKIEQNGARKPKLRSPMVYSLVLCMIEFGSVYSQLVEGWLFDAYPLGVKMVSWTKQENGDTIRLEGNWSHSII